MVEEDIPAAIGLWQGLPGIGLRGADSPPALARFLRRNPGASFAAVNDSGELIGVSLAGHDGPVYGVAWARRGDGRRPGEHHGEMHDRAVSASTRHGDAR